jgi:dTDP-4-dehydrorhamnose reductase
MTATRPKKVLITGSSGYVGQHLISSLLADGYTDKSDESDDHPTDDDDDDGGHDGDRDDDDGGRPRYELYLSYRSLPTFEVALDRLISSLDVESESSRARGGTRRRRRRRRRPAAARVVRTIPGVDFSRPGYLDDVRRGARGEGGDCEDAKFDAIVHLAAISSPAKCEEDPGLAYEVNCPADLLELGAPVIYASTDQVYDGTKPFNEEDADIPNPANVYGRTKLSFERALLATPGGGHVALRCSLVLGPPAPMGGAHPTFLQFVEGRLNDSIPTDYYVDEWRSCVHVDDVVRAMRHFLDDVLYHGGGGGEGGGGGAKRGAGSNATATEDTTTTNDMRVYNLGGRTRASRHEMAAAVASRLKSDPSSINAMSRPRDAFPPSPPDISMNVDKITRELFGGGGGGATMMGLEEIVASTFPLAAPRGR